MSIDREFAGEVGCHPSTRPEDFSDDIGPGHDDRSTSGQRALVFGQNPFMSQGAGGYVDQPGKDHYTPSVQARDGCVRTKVSHPGRG